MKVLFIGGTGIISTACADRAVARGMDVTLLNRSKRPGIPGTRSLVADLAEPASVARVLEGKTWDSVIDFMAFSPTDIEMRLSLFRAKVGQFIFISSASAYQKSLTDYLITESTPLANPLWDYSRNKIAREERLMRAYREEAFPITIIRPSLTYGDICVPLAMNSWHQSYTAIDRMRSGKAVVIPGDGLCLWTITHNSDFAKGLVGLLGHSGSIGHAFHITSDEALTWNQISEMTAEASGVTAPKWIHIASDFIAACLPGTAGSLLGDKSHSAVFDNAKIKRFVPEFKATTRYRDGIQRTIAWFDADPGRRRIDAEANLEWDRLITLYDRGLQAAVTEFASSRPAAGQRQ